MQLPRQKKKLHENPDAILYIVGFYEKNLPLDGYLSIQERKREKQFMKLAMVD